MKIKNYTSSVAVSSSIEKIRKTLLSHGAKSVLFYQNEVFFVAEHNGRDFSFKVPARVNGSFQQLKEQRKRISAESERRIFLQSEKTAWKNLLDLIHSLTTLMMTSEAGFLELFLQYAVCDIREHKTFYETLEGSGFKLLGTGSSIN